VCISQLAEQDILRQRPQQQGENRELHAQARQSVPDETPGSLAIHDGGVSSPAIKNSSGITSSANGADTASRTYATVGLSVTSRTSA
jgi:hypothetical protein